MVDFTVITSIYATNIGAMIVNLAKRGVIVRVGVEPSILTGDILIMTLSVMKGSQSYNIREALTEEQVTNINDVGVVCDALYAKLMKGMAAK